VDPAAPPTFLNFFRPSKAHYDAATGQLQKIYRLNGGQWAPVAPGETIAAGRRIGFTPKGRRTTRRHFERASISATDWITEWN